MPRITVKTVQVHESWTDGYNEVYPYPFEIRWADLAKHRIRRRRDASTGKPFLLLVLEHSGPFYCGEPFEY